MRKSLIILLTFVSYTQLVLGQDKFKIKGELNNVPTSSKVYLEYNNKNGERIVDSTKLVNGNFFEFNGEVDFSSTATLHVASEDAYFGNKTKYIETKSFILNRGVMNIKGSNLDDAVKTAKHHTSTKVSINFSKEDKTDTTKYPRSFGGLTFSRVDWGFSRLMDDGSFNLSEDNSFLDYKKASNFGFDLLQYGLRFNDKFKTYLSAGFEWNYLRLKENVLLSEDGSPIAYTMIDKNVVEYKKNIFTTTYLRVPLTFEWRSAQNHKGDRVKVAFGAMTGILLKGTQRLKSKEDGKQKFKDNYSLATFQYGPFLRIGYDNLGLFGKYYVNDMFEKSPNQEGLKNLTFGLTLGF